MQNTITPSFWWVLVAGLFIAALFQPSATRRITEIVCKGGPGALDADFNCKQSDRFGKDLEFKINANTQKVQGAGEGWFRGAIMNCSVVDYDNWRCDQGVVHNGMWHGRYYEVTDASDVVKFDQYDKSGISTYGSIDSVGLWLYRVGVIDLPHALKW